MDGPVAEEHQTPNQYGDFSYCSGGKGDLGILRLEVAGGRDKI